MDEEKKPLGVVVPGKGHRFAPGHAKLGGRGKGAQNKVTWIAREIAERKGFNPISWLMDAVTVGTIPGPEGKGTVPVPLEERMKCARDLMRYLAPTLSAVQVSGVDNAAPDHEARLDIRELMKNPELAAAAQKLAAGMIEAQTAQRDPANWSDDPAPVSGEVLTDEDED